MCPSFVFVSIWFHLGYARTITDITLMQKWKDSAQSSHHVAFQRRCRMWDSFNPNQQFFGEHPALQAFLENYGVLFYFFRGKYHMKISASASLLLFQHSHGGSGHVDTELVEISGKPFWRAPLEPVSPTIPQLETVVYKENNSRMILCTGQYQTK